MKEKKKFTKKKVIIIILVVLGIFILIPVIPFLVVSASLIFSMIKAPAEPTITHGEFPFKLVYEYNGEEKTIDDKIICDYEGYSYAVETGNTRDWECYTLNEGDYNFYYLDKEKYPDLFIYVPYAAEYYMGAPESENEERTPLIRYTEEETGTNYYEPEKIDSVGVKIISFTPSMPIENEYK